MTGATVQVDGGQLKASCEGGRRLGSGGWSRLRRLEVGLWRLFSKRLVAFRIDRSAESGCHLHRHSIQTPASLPETTSRARPATPPQTNLQSPTSNLRSVRTINVAES